MTTICWIKKKEAMIKTEYFKLCKECIELDLWTEQWETTWGHFVVWRLNSQFLLFSVFLSLLYIFISGVYLDFWKYFLQFSFKPIVCDCSSTTGGWGIYDHRPKTWPCKRYLFLMSILADCIVWNFGPTTWFWTKIFSIACSFFVKETKNPNAGGAYQR